MKSTRQYLFIFTAFIFTFPLQGAIRLPKLISVGMVLQRDAKVTGWGWADSSENISTSIDGKTYNTTVINNL